MFQKIISNKRKIILLTTKFEDILGNSAVTALESMKYSSKNQILHY